MHILSNFDNYSLNLVNRLSFGFSESCGEKDLFEVAGDFSLYVARKSFGVELISNHQNKVQAEKIHYSVIHIFLFILTLPLSSLVSLTGVVLISLSKTHQDKFNQFQEGVQPPSFLPSTVSNLTINSLSLPVSSSPPNPLPSPVNEKLSSAQFLDELSKRSMSIYEEESDEHTAHLWGTFGTLRHLWGTFGTLRNDFTPGICTHVSIDSCKLSNIMSDCQGDGEAYFIPANSWENALRKRERELEPQKADHLAFLIKTLSAAFETGKKIVVARLANGIHTAAAGFCVDGRFKIIDSMLDSTVNIRYLGEQLNKASLKNSEGNIIHFKGEYINTSIQRGGHECIRFATLYCYQMYKKKDLNAFEEVNGAFSEGKLKRFEDYKQISGSKKIRSFSGSSSKDLYDKFMRSWAYRTQDMLVDTWEEINLTSRLQESEKMEIYYLENNPNFPPGNISSEQIFIVDKKGTELTINSLNDMPKEQEIPLSTDDSVVLGSLASPNKEKRLLIFEYGQNQPRLYRLLPHQQVFYSFGGDRNRLEV